MNGFKTSRVVVIDDLREEALPVIEAFGRLGIGCVYISGEKLEDLPKTPLSGIRLVVLDMRLGTTGGDKQTSAVTANVFNRVISPDDGPLVVLLWTKHNEDIPAFQNALFGIEPKFRSTLLIADLEKPAAMDGRTVNKILKKIKALAKQWEPVDFLWYWEQLAHDAATATVGTLAKNVTIAAAIDAADTESVRKDKWLSALRHLLRNLAQAAAGKGASAVRAKEDILEALTALHGDKLEGELVINKGPDLKTVFEAPLKRLSIPQVAALNSLLLQGSVSAGPQEMRPGNVYLYYIKRPGVFKPCGISVAKLCIEIVCQLEKDSAFREGKELAKKFEADQKKYKEYTDAIDKRRVELWSACRPILIEITPSCDFAQRNRHQIRLAGGLLVPENLTKLVPANKESIRKLELLPVPGLQGLWLPVLSGRFLLTVAESSACSRVLPAFRLRAQILTDLRNWYASQSARSGYLSLQS